MTDNKLSNCSVHIDALVMPDGVFLKMSADELRVDLMNVSLIGVVIAFAAEVSMMLANASGVVSEAVVSVSNAKAFCTGIMIDAWMGAVTEDVPDAAVKILVGADTIISVATTTAVEFKSMLPTSEEPLLCNWEACSSDVSVAWKCCVLHTRMPSYHV